MHITLRAIGGLASFRQERLVRAFQNAVKPLAVMPGLRNAGLRRFGALHDWQHPR